VGIAHEVALSDEPLLGRDAVTATRLLLLLIVWCAIGVAASIAMGRRGHNPFAWLILGAILGPLVIPVASVSVREERMGLRRELVEGSPGAGSVDIVVGIDGSPESEGALQTVVRLFSTRIGRLTLVYVEDFDSAGSRTPLDVEKRSAVSLEKIASSAEVYKPAAVIITGRAADALMRYGVEEGYGVIAIGRRGRGATKRLLGSTAIRLSQGADLPVLII
jgi:nucleotide-binding universal stress UspA family protein